MTPDQEPERDAARQRSSKDIIRDAADILRLQGAKDQKTPAKSAKSAKRIKKQAGGKTISPGSMKRLLWETRPEPVPAQTTFDYIHAVAADLRLVERKGRNNLPAAQKNQEGVPAPGRQEKEFRLEPLPIPAPVSPVTPAEPPASTDSAAPAEPAAPIAAAVYAGIKQGETARIHEPKNRITLMAAGVGGLFLLLSAWYFLPDRNGVAGKVSSNDVSSAPAFESGAANAEFDSKTLRQLAAVAVSQRYPDVDFADFDPGSLVRIEDPKGDAQVRFVVSWLGRKAVALEKGDTLALDRKQVRKLEVWLGGDGRILHVLDKQVWLNRSLNKPKKSS